MRANKYILLFLFFLTLLCQRLFAQGRMQPISSLENVRLNALSMPEFPCMDTFSSQEIENRVRPKLKKYYEYPYYYFLNYDFYTTVMASFSKNPIDPNTEHSNIYYYYNINLNNQLHLKTFKINTFFFNEFGKRFYMDSVSTIIVDQYYFKNTFNFILLFQKCFLTLFHH